MALFAKCQGATHPRRPPPSQGVLELEIAKAIPDTIGEVVVYGERGLQSLLAATTLLQKGYSNVSSLAGGWGQWISGGGEIEK